jgi:iron-sulfur cluster assembly protein
MLHMAILVTPEAADQLKRAHSDSQLSPETFVRVGVVAGGCSGFEYAMNFDDHFDETKDSRYEQNGISVVVDKKSALLLDGTTLDWFSSLERSGFTFNNPNAVKSCGCGKSFQ